MQTKRIRGATNVPYFVAAIRHGDASQGANASPRAFEEAVGAPVSASWLGGGMLVQAAFPCSRRVSVAAQGNTVVLLQGDVWDCPGENPAAVLAREHAHQGAEAPTRVHGSYAALVLDLADGVAHAITDRVNSHRIFYSQLGEDTWLSTALLSQPLSGAAADPVGVACYLANGAVFGGVTPFSGVRLMPPGSIYTFTPSGMRRSAYWRLEYTGEYAGKDERTLRQDLQGILVDSVRRRVDGATSVFLSLSGGYDSTLLLGILRATLSRRDVECFAYVQGRLADGQDAAVAQHTARHFGVPLKVYQEYSGDLIGFLARNAALGEGVAPPCYEIEVYDQMAAELGATPWPILLTGDECFGDVPWGRHVPVDSRTRLLYTLQIRDFGAFRWLARQLDPVVGHAMLCGLRELIFGFLSAQLGTESLRDLRDRLYIEQRMGHHILPYRYRTMAASTRVSAPFLDDHVIEFMRRVPASLRAGKALFVAAATDMFPQAFEGPRARLPRVGTHWRTEITRHRDLLAESLAQPSRLDQLIPPHILRSVLDANAATPSGDIPGLGIIRLRNRVVRVPPVDRFARSFPGRHDMHTDYATLLLRLFILREVLR